jgi:hypothetical protein
MTICSNQSRKACFPFGVQGAYTLVRNQDAPERTE